MLDISYIMGFIGVAVGILIGVFIYSEVEVAVDCPEAATDPDGNAGCLKAKGLTWSVIGILPIALFFGLFSIFGGFNRIL